MREIKFRGRQLTDGDWMHGDLITETDGNLSVKRMFIHNRISPVDFSENFMTSKLCLCEIDPKTVGQFTGLYDKNGKEIFEGDEIQHSDSKGFIIHKADSFIIEWWHDADFFNEHLRIHHSKVEIIGNTHDEKE